MWPRRDAGFVWLKDRSDGCGHVAAALWQRCTALVRNVTLCVAVCGLGEVQWMVR